MKKSQKNISHESPGSKPEKNSEQEKDYAHYPPAPAKQVKPAAHKSQKEKQSVSNGGWPGPQPAEKASDNKIVNGSNKIVNAVDESYSDASGGAFEATEQVND